MPGKFSPNETHPTPPFTFNFERESLTKLPRLALNSLYQASLELWRSNRSVLPSSVLLFLMLRVMSALNYQLSPVAVIIFRFILVTHVLGGTSGQGQTNSNKTVYLELTFPCTQSRLYVGSNLLFRLPCWAPRPANGRKTKMNHFPVNILQSPEETARHLYLGKALKMILGPARN